MIDLEKFIIHDLTHSLNDQMVGFSSKPAKTLTKDGWNARTLSIYSHAGTHMDSPFHFGVSNETIDDFTPENLMCSADILEVEIKEAKQLITIESLGTLAKNFTSGNGLLICTKWSDKLNDINFKKDLPRISEDLAIWCVEKKVKILGVEPLSVADVENIEEVTKIHQILLGGKVVILEGLKNLDKIKKKEVFLIALPLKIENGDGAPARVIAFEENGD
ncbi:cyclase family protein [Reichenbachiella versicolor]|uniref:cyclase family protein n=1 Tax=Reichenbachiella versicolor TaxID=1821036 RepID=UPI000D6E83E0|nr:cyclase family protein [Reichenbachiella versicolor]